MVWMPLAWMPPSGVPVVLKSQFYGLTIVIECVKRVILKAHVGHYEAQPKFKLLPVYRIPYTHLFTHGFRGIIHTYLYLQVLQIKQIQKHSSTKIPLQLTSRDVTTIHPNTLCSPKKLEEKIYDHQKHKLYVKFIM